LGSSYREPDGETARREDEETSSMMEQVVVPQNVGGFGFGMGCFKFLLLKRIIPPDQD